MGVTANDNTSPIVPVLVQQLVQIFWMGRKLLMKLTTETEPGA